VTGADSIPAPFRRRHRWVYTAACIWALAFAAPHIWWAAGVEAGFPGGPASHAAQMRKPWFVAYDLLVVALSVLAFVVARTLGRPSRGRAPRWILVAMAWIASGMLSLRGVAGMVVDGASDPVWWPTFLIGGILFGSVGWLSRSVGGDRSL
jgi:hypothetical protein